MFTLTDLDRLRSRGDTYRLLNTHTSARYLAWWLTGLLIVFFISGFLPWRQTITGSGSIIPLDPEKRPQQVHAVIDGRIEKWFVAEGEPVAAGDTILLLSEVKEKFFDPSMLNRMEAQIDALEASGEAYQDKVAALDQQILNLRASMDLSLQKAENEILQARMKIATDSAAVEAAEIDFAVAQERNKRTENLYNQGLKSLTDLESSKLKLQEASAKLTLCQNKLLESRNEYLNKIIAARAVSADYLGKISKAVSDKNSAVIELQDNAGKLAKMQTEYANLDIRSGFYVVKAPQSGFIQRAGATGVGELIKAGEPLLTLAPDLARPAAELYIAAHDVPLVSPGRKVRLEFEGWPAIQVSGWPSVSVGTFGGIVHVVDRVSNEEGKYRILITPDPDDTPWPAELRTGSGVNGWALLDRIPVWYEVWRRMNGFPPSLQSKPGTDGKKKK